MTLEDFERKLEQSKGGWTHHKRSRSSEDHERVHGRRGHHHKHSKEESRDKGGGDHSHDRQRKRSKRPDDPPSKVDNQDEKAFVGKDGQDFEKIEAKRDSWMEGPSKLDIEMHHRKPKCSPLGQHLKSLNEENKSKISKNELNHQQGEVEVPSLTASTGLEKPIQHEAGYTFGDAGSHWRMTKLKATHRQAKESGRLLDEVAIERYGDLSSFDDAAEEEIELDRRERYGQGYIGKEKPSGELFQKRRLECQDQGQDPVLGGARDGRPEVAHDELSNVAERQGPTIVMDQTALNKLKAQMMKARLKGGPEATRLETKYSEALAILSSHQRPDVVVLNDMENRMLAGGRKGEVNALDNKRGRERGLVEENEDMSIADMVRQERRTKGQSGGEGRAFAERIAKDAKFDTDLDYMDENATKLSKHVQRSDNILRNTAVSEYQKIKHILDTCPLCYHEDTSIPPQAPLVSLATRTFLTIPTSPEITPYGLCAAVVPIQHRLNLLECDDDEWEEIRNFMKSLSRFYFAQDPPYGVVFYENAAHEGRKRHASLDAIPLPLELSATAPAFFREAILAADEEWAQHRKLIDTQAKANDGLGKRAFRRSMVSELPYFHVWFTLDGGMGHVVEDSRRWPKGDLFAREVIGGMLDVGAEVIKRQGRWKQGDADMEKRVKFFRKGWEHFDWTKVLIGP